MTHILQATHAAWLAFTGNDNQDAFGICSPIITVPYNAAQLFMDVTIYDQGIALNDGSGKQIQYTFNQVDQTKPFNIGTGPAYSNETDFYYQHHSGSDPFTAVQGIPILKNGGPWSAGDRFVLSWLFYFTNHNLVTGIKSIRIY